METARTRSIVTLSALVVILIVMAVVGWKSATTAFPTLSGKVDKQDCTSTRVKGVIYRKEITVSVYNASDQSGLAKRIMGSMQRRNFVVGTIGNAPEGTKVDRVAIYTTVKDDPRAQLVAMQYKPTAPIVVSDDALGAGIDVVLGNDTPNPVVPAPKSLKLAKPITTCIARPRS